MRVENLTMQGVPDINCCWDGKEIWIESKIYYPEHNSPLLEPEQHAWGFRRTHNGGKVWVLALHGEVIHAYKHKLVVELAASKYVRIKGAQVQFTFNRKDIQTSLVWKTLFNN